MSLKTITTALVVAMLAATPISKASAQGADLSDVKVYFADREERYFKIDQGMELCPHGTWIHYNGNWHNYDDLVVYYEDGLDVGLTVIK